MHPKNKRKTTVKVLAAINIAVICFWAISQLFNVYKFAVTGAVFEILWAPMMFGLFLMPLVCLFLWHKERYRFPSAYLYLLVTSVSTVIFLLMF